MTKFRVLLKDIKPKDMFVTPATKLPFQVNSFGKKRFNHVLNRWELPATCTWLDTGVHYSTVFTGKGILTLEHKRVNPESKV